MRNSLKLKVKNLKFHSNYTLYPIRYTLRCGFTIVELLLYMGLFLMLLTVLGTLFGMITDANIESQGTSAVQQDGRYLLAKLPYDLDQASSITTPALGATSSSTSFVSGGVTYTLSVVNGNLVAADSLGNSDSLNSYGTTVSAFSVKRLGNVGGKNTLFFSFTLTGKAVKQSGAEVATYQTSVGIR